jgi:adenylosuccinate synthase
MEYGASTGRPRRCGCMTAVALLYARTPVPTASTASRSTKLDCARRSSETIEICTGYKIGGSRTVSEFRPDLNSCGPILADARIVAGLEDRAKGATRSALPPKRTLHQAA